jgi:hypothetical protein
MNLFLPKAITLVLLPKAIFLFCMWANSPEGQFVLGTLSPQIYSQESAIKELMRRMENDGSLEEFEKLKKEWRKTWEK